MPHTKSGIVLIVLALVLAFVTFVDLCAIVAPNCGWDPFCWVGALFSGANCNLVWGIMAWILRGGAAMIFIVGIWRLIKK